MANPLKKKALRKARPRRARAGAARAHVSRRKREAPPSAIYLYGITQPPARPAPALEGVEGLARVESVSCAGLVCWVSRVSRRDFADRLAENMENLEWLAAASVRHQRVVSEIAAQAAVLPARFGTVFLTKDSLANHVRRRKRSLLAAFRRIAGADEWGVKVFAVPRAPAAVTAPSGKEYLQRKAAMLETRPGRALDPEVNSLATALKRIALDTAAAGKVSGGQRGLEWQVSLLLRRSRRRQLQSLLDRFAARWRERRRIECTGPWPPYSFVSAHAD